MGKKQSIKYACLIGAFLSQLFLQQTFFTYTGSDRNKQLLATKSFIEGYGFSLSQADPQNLSTPIFSPLQDWPLGYSILAVPFYYIFGDWMICAKALAILGLGLVFIAAHLLFKQYFPHSHHLYIAFFAFWGISFTPFYYTSASGELALGFFLLGLWGVGRIFKPAPAFEGRELLPSPILFKKGLGVVKSICSILLFTLSASMRYAYLPMIWILPILILIRYIRKAPISKTLVAINFAFATFATYLFLGFKTPSSASGRSIFQLPETLHLENWMNWDAFPIKAFAYMSIEGLLNKLPISSIGIWGLKILLGGGALFIIGLGIYFIYPLFKTFLAKKHLPLSPTHWVITTFIAAVGIVVVMLAILSLLHPAEIHDYAQRWTYVMETRYYALPMIGIQLLLWWIIFGGKQKINKYLYLLTLSFLLVCTCYSGLHSAFRYYQRLIQNNVRETVYDIPSQRMKKIQQMVDTQQVAGKQYIFVYGNSMWQRDEAIFAALSGANVIASEDLAQDAPISDNMIIITNIPEDEWDLRHFTVLRVP